MGVRLAADAEEFFQDWEVGLHELAQQPLLQVVLEPDEGFQASARVAQDSRMQPVAVGAAACSAAIAVVKERIEMPGAVAGMCAESWSAEFAAGCLYPTQFQADNLRMHAAAWRQWVDDTSKEGRLVRQWVQHGFSFLFMAPATEPDDRRGSAAGRLEAFRALVGGRMTDQQVADAVRQPLPPPLHLPNHASVVAHAQFVEEELLQCLRTGAVSIVPKEDAHCLLGLGVVANRHGKLRLIFDARPLNLWQVYTLFSFKRLSDLPQYLEQNDLLVVLDAKSGYHHIGVAAAHRRYLCVEFRGVVLRFNVLPFGVAQACWVYTIIMRQVYGPLRAKGWRLTHYLDDLLLAQQPLERALYDARTVALLFTALGLFMSLPKCQVWPQPGACFLGLQVDTCGLQFSIPDEKLQYILGVLCSVLAAPGASRRQYARVSGLLAAVAPALPMNRLYLRGLYEVLQGTKPWDEVFPHTAAGRQELRWWCANLSGLHGCGWQRFQRIIVIVGDVSETGYAGYTPAGEVQGCIGHDFTQAETARLEAGEFSSTERETLCAELCVMAVIQALGPATCTGRCIRYIGDNLGSISALQRLTGGAHVFDIVKRLHLYCYGLGIQLDFQWRPRADAQLAYADELSRHVDGSAVYITASAYRWVCTKMGCHPNLDVFAGGGADEHRTWQYFSLWACPGSSGVDAFAHDWRITPQTHVPALVWAFPPEWCIAACISKIAQEQVACLLVVPAGKLSFWRPLLDRLPVQRRLKLPYCVPAIYWMGSQAPPEWRVQQRKFSFEVVKVCFP